MYEYIVNQCIIKEGQLATRSEMEHFWREGGVPIMGTRMMVNVRWGMVEMRDN